MKLIVGLDVFVFIMSKNMGKLMKTIIWKFCLLIFIYSNSVYANGIIKGSVYDAETNLTLQSARVSLLNYNDSTVIKGDICSKDGSFEIKDVKFDKYLLKISYIGYLTYWNNEINVSKNENKIDIGKISLVKSELQTSDVIVTAEKSLITYDRGKTIVNIENNPGAQNGSAVDALKTAPMVEVTPEGEIKLRGKSNVKILIDGKPSQMQGQDPKKVLDQIPASAVDNIEINTNPSAKYEAEGSTGIINIVLKKKKDLGLNGLLDIGLGSDEAYNGDLNLNYRKDNYNIFGGYNFYIGQYPYSNTNKRTAFDSPSAMYYTSFSDGRGKYNSNSAKIGLDYDISDKHSITISGNISKSKNESNGNQQSTFSNFENIVNLTNVQNDNNDSPYDSYNISTYYKFDIDSGGHQLTSDIYYYHWTYNAKSLNNVETYDANSVLVPDSLTNKVNSLNAFDNFNADIDYEYPFNDKIRLESGVKIYYSYSENKSDYQNYDPFEHIWKLNSDKTTDYNNTQTTLAAYMILNHNLDGFNYQIGLRAEQFKTQGDIKTQGLSINKTYFDIFPTFSMSYSFSEAEQLQISYSKRTERPSFWYLVPFEDKSNPNSISKGNPDLKPEYTHSFELGYTDIFGKHTITPSVFYRRELASITDFSYVNSENILYKTFGNFTDSHNYGIDANYQGRFFDIITLGINASYYFFNYNVELPNKKYKKNDKSWNLSGNFSVNPIESFFVQGFCYYRPAMENATGKSNSVIYSNISLRYEMLNGNLEFNLNLSDPFKLINYGRTILGEGYLIESTYKYNTRSISFGIKYKINDGFKTREKSTESVAKPPSGPGR